MDKIGLKYRRFAPPSNDWGEMIESEWGRNLLEQTFKRFHQSYANQSM